jgi:hypothetical protein
MANLQKQLVDWCHVPICYWDRRNGIGHRNRFHAGRQRFFRAQHGSQIAILTLCLAVHDQGFQLQRTHNLNCPNRQTDPTERFGDTKRLYLGLLA